MNQSKLTAGIDWLHNQGLNLFAILETENALNSIQGISAQCFDKFRTLLNRYPRLILAGHGGNKMWQSMDGTEDAGEAPVDNYSLHKVQYFVQTYLGTCDTYYLYPGETMIPLQQLGSMAGWHHPSPLGMGINSTYGLWFGYRVALMIDLDLPPSEIQHTQSPCDNCDRKPCINACPVGALSHIASPDLELCLNQRLADHSTCALKCDARLACPIATQHRYTNDQLSYHYRHSLDSIRRYRSAKSKV